LPWPSEQTAAQATKAARGVLLRPADERDQIRHLLRIELRREVGRHQRQREQRHLFDVLARNDRFLSLLAPQNDHLLVRHYSRRTEVAYVTWIRRDIGLHHKAHPTSWERRTSRRS